ncbi:polyprenyl synthetase family protein [Streptomyces formicae]
MLGLRSTTAEQAKPVEAPLTAIDATTSVETVLAQVLDARRRQAQDIDPVSAQDVADRITSFVQRGGKRLRTAFAWCGWRAAGGCGDATAVLRTGAALELVQACALIHDDVMDGSPIRRGAAAMHVDFEQMHLTDRMRGSPESFATAAAVLAGDMALVWADDLLTETALSTAHGVRLYGEWRDMRAEMVAGQYRDIHAEATGASGLDEAVVIAILKSALYTVERPLALGASLAAADDQTLDALRAAGRCAGLAFQLRDDLNGTFGDPALTGKPADDDLRTRKLTYLLAVALTLADTTGDTEAAEVLAPGALATSHESLARMRDAIERTGARAAAEAEISELAAMSLRYFARASSDPALRGEFAALVERASGAMAFRTGRPR